MKEIYSKINGYKYIGVHKSSGKANGRPMFEGPCGGIFYINENFNRSYISKFSK